MKALFEKYKHLIAYLFFGGVTTLVNMAVYYLCYHLLGWPNTISTILAWLLSVITAFFTNKPWVFESHDWRLKTLAREMASFFGSRLATGLLDLLMMFLLVDLLKWPGLAMKLIANIIVIILNYLFSKWFVFKKK